MARLPILLALPALLLFACDPGAGADDDGVGDPDAGNPDTGTPDTGTPDTPTAPPDTTLTVTPDPLTNQVPARFEFTADRDATFRCAIDDAPEADCTSPHDVSVDDGLHTFSVRAVGIDGATDESPARHAWTTDTVAPETTFTVVPPALDNSTTLSVEFAASEDATFTCALDGGAAAPCTSPHQLTGLLDGPHRFTVTARDGAGNLDASPAEHPWSIDSSTPDTAIDSGPSGAVATPDAVFVFSSPDAGAGATFECALDGAPWVACTSPRNLTSLAQGPHSFEVRVRDATGNLDPTPARREWTVDSVGPTATLMGPPSPMNDRTPAFTFTLFDAPTVVECRFDGDAFVPCTSPYQPAVPLTDGDHTFEVHVADAAGNASTSSLAFTVDTVAPVVAIAPLPSPTNDRTPTFMFTVNGGATAVQCGYDGAGFAACASPYTGAAELTNGTHRFEVRATDAAGNTGSATREIVVDGAAPTVTIVAGPPLGALINDSTPTFTFAVTDAPTVVECRFDGGAFAPCTSPYTPAPLADGDHSFEVRVADDAGNSGSASRAFTLDSEPPVITIAALPSPTNDRTPTFTFTVSGNPTTVACGYDGANFAVCTSPYTRPNALFDGNHVFEVRATDAAGNTGSATRAIIIDATQPTVTIVSGPAPGAMINDSTPAFGFTLTDAPTVVECRFDAAAFAPCTSPHEPAAPLADGSHTFEIHVADAAGNSNSVSRAFTLDTAVPTVTIELAPALTNDSTPTFTFSVSGATTVQCGYDGAGFTTCTSPYTRPAALTDGDHVFEVRASDAAGNVGNATRAITIDTVAPTATILSGPAEGELINDNTPSFTFSVSGNPTSIRCRVTSMFNSVPCDPAVTFEPIDRHIDGNARFFIFLEDAAGNTSTTVRNYRVDATPPTVYIIGPQDGAPVNTRTPSWTIGTDASATEVACRIDSAPFGPCTSFTSFVAPPLADGPHTVEVRARDHIGNEAFASGQFVVVGPPQ